MLREYAPLMVALLAGGLSVSLGATLLGRSASGRAELARTSGSALALLAVVALAIAVAGAYWAITPLLGALGAGADAELGTSSPARLFMIGALVGLPFSLPGVGLAWQDARSDASRRSKRKDAVATKNDRRTYAQDLLRQMHDVSPRPRKLRVSVGGDGGRVLTFEGDIEPTEVERLTAALRQDLKDLGFKRVEGANGSKRRWTKV